MAGAEVRTMNRVTQFLLAAGALAVAVIVGVGAVSRGNAGHASATPRATPVPLVTFTAPVGWVVDENAAVLKLARGPTEGQPSVARIMVCRNAYAVTADGQLAHGLDTGAAKITFRLLKRADLRTVISPHEATLAGLNGHYLDFKIPASSQVGRDADTWVALTDQANCFVVFDTSIVAGEAEPGTEITVPTIARLGLFELPDGGNLMVLMASEGIGSRGVPDRSDIEEATGIVEGFSFHSAEE
jgi:hypothetical protein